ncbi:basic-leucine zipper domain-containing/DNA binding domain-containingprotein [Purpureocillium lavendulum]|uniref:Basic-leucine zipper domain-containing/DNA binding domain-containingprotein n=1 Tax=Purpureocillium lavendulum TaxID=1247861 RepID=A0AB34G4R0_9HYPO|nr:basic-leucine zipper domain-containing/DNA binding domain-containingprotein [Purpureocillium lavendulum]
MVPQFPSQAFYRAANLTVDTSHAQQKYVEDEDKSVLDDTVLDHNTIDSGLELSPPMADSRRESFAVSGTLFSPKTEDWQSVDMQSVPSNNPFFEQPSGNSNNPFMRMDHSQGHAFGQQPGGSWLMSSGSGTTTPFHPFEAISAEYDAGSSIFQRPVQGSNGFNAVGNIFAPLGSGEQQIPTSPQKEWMATAQSAAKKMRSSSPGIRSHNDLRRGDGIRKKNARFEIPAERNLNNIDQLIASSTDEQEIKELKQQKRLLRNRQAALDSRQRKKLHTERLEDEKKHYTAVITELEEEVTGLKSKMDQLLREKQSCMDYIETLTLEKDEMIRAHTLETGDLRKKVGILTEHVQRLEAAPLANATASHMNHGFPGAYDEMNDMDMTGAWDNPGFLHDYAPEHEVKQELPILPAKKSEGTLADDGEKGASQGGLLFMLFLVGAFVMSRGSTPPITRVSDDVRVASETLLQNVFNDAGVKAHGLQPMGPQPSGTVGWPQPSATSGPMGGMHVAPSMLEELGDALAQPTEQQTNEHIFSMSPNQYNGVHNQDFNPPKPSTSQGRKNLAEALAEIRDDKPTGAAEVYTRTLLWNQIPREVVRNFAKMVSECSNAQNEQQCNDTT